MSNGSLVEQLNTIWWIRIPLRVGRRSRVIAGILMDGLYLSAVPILSACGPPLLLVLGLITGWLHPTFPNEEVFTASLFVLIIMIGVSTMSAAWGAWVTVGYIIGDNLLYQHQAYRQFSGQLLKQLLLVHLPLFIPYILLAFALMFIPLISRLLGSQILGWIKHTGSVTITLQALIQGVLHGMLIFMWTQATPTLIRPVYTWSGRLPSTSVIQPLQRFGVLLAVFAGAFGAIRVIAERRTVGQLHIAQRAAALQTALRANVLVNRDSLPSWTIVLVKTLFTTFLLAGLFESLFDAVLFAIVLALMLFGRRYLSERMSLWVQVVTRVPLPIRLAVGVALNWFLSTLIITALWSSNRTFHPITISVVFSLLVFFLLMPELSRRQSTATTNH